jgi:hypothetical protein
VFRRKPTRHSSRQTKIQSTNHQLPPRQLISGAWAAVAGVAVLSAGPEKARATAVAAMFESWCLSSSFAYHDLDRRATQAHYEVIVDRTMPMPSGESMRQNQWLIPSPGGAPITLNAIDVTHDSLHVLGCGVYGPDLDGPAMESALSGLPRLGAPTKHAQPPEGSTVWWNARVGDRPASEDSEVMMSKDTPGMPGVSVNLILKFHQGAQTRSSGPQRDQIDLRM